MARGREDFHAFAIGREVDRIQEVAGLVRRILAGGGALVWKSGIMLSGMWTTKDVILGMFDDFGADQNGRFFDVGHDAANKVLGKITGLRKAYAFAFSKVNSRET